MYGFAYVICQDQDFLLKLCQYQEFISVLLKKFYRYKVREVFCGDGSALVEWRLETGRTHQVIALHDSLMF
jgi:hypothetical protein